MQAYYEEWKKTAQARKMLETWVLDPEGILTGNGYVEGVYEISYLHQKSGKEISSYIGQAGYAPTAPSYVASDVYERVLQHLKRWLGGDYLTFWSGLKASDSAEFKIVIRLLCEEKNHSARLALETKFIDERHPFLQDAKDGQFDLYPTRYGYNRNDLTIFPWKREGETDGQRRVAFLAKLSELHIES